MKNYKAEIEKMVLDAACSGEDYDAMEARKISYKILSLIREIVQEACAKSEYTILGNVSELDRIVTNMCNKTREETKFEILSNVEKLMGGE